VRIVLYGLLSLVDAPAWLPGGEFLSVGIIVVPCM
jgi:hypothetical protein